MMTASEVSAIRRHYTISLRTTKRHSKYIAVEIQHVKQGTKIIKRTESVEDSSRIHKQQKMWNKKTSSQNM